MERSLHRVCVQGRRGRAAPAFLVFSRPLQLSPCPRAATTWTSCLAPRRRRWSGTAQGSMGATRSRCTTYPTPPRPSAWTSSQRRVQLGCQFGDAWRWCAAAAQRHAHVTTARRSRLTLPQHPPLSPPLQAFFGSWPEVQEEGPRRYGPNAAAWVRVQEGWTLRDALCRPDHIIPGVPAFFVLAKGTDFRDAFLEGDMPLL